MSLRSRSRIRRIEFRFDSMEARSVGSGKFPSSSMFSTVLPASNRSSLMRWFRRLRKYSTSLWFREHLLRRRKLNGVHYREKLININRESVPRILAAKFSLHHSAKETGRGCANTKTSVLFGNMERFNVN